MAVLAAFLVGGGIMLATYSVIVRGADRRQALKQVLELELEKPSKSPEALSDMMERAGAFAERAIGKTNRGGELRTRLVRSGSKLKVGEFVAITGLWSVVVGVLGLSLTRSVLTALVLALAVPLVANARLKAKNKKRLIKLESQLPGVLQLLAGSLDSGSSLLLAMELAGEEGDPPLSIELGRVVAESQVGRPLLESLEAMAERVDSRDISWTVEAIRIQHQTGGRLADTLRVLADFMHVRLEVRGEIRALSAEARISGKILIGMPLAIGAFLFLTRREYVQPLLTTGLGRLMLGGAVVGVLIGHFIMRRQVLGVEL
jgi:tight adherence protein B